MTGLDARAFWVAAPGRGDLRAAALPPVGDGDVLVRTLYSGISRGTESLVFTGRVPVSEHQRMRAPFQEGDFPAPVKYGYASVGIVEQGPSALEGHQVFSLFPHQTRYVIPVDAVHLVPENVPQGRAVLAANMETAINGVWDADVRVGDRVVVIGGGTVGCLVAWLASRIPGCGVELVDINPDRALTARVLRVAFSQPETVAGNADVVIHASGSPAGLALALDLAGFESRIVELSWYGDREVTVPLGGAFHARRLQIQSSQVGAVAGPQRSRWTHRRRMSLALALLANDELDVMISGESAFDELPDVMPRLCASPTDVLCHRVHY